MSIDFNPKRWETVKRNSRLWWAGELERPLIQATLTPAAGEKFSLTVAVSDADAVPGKGFNYLSWTPGIHYGKSPSGMADITLIKSKLKNKHGKLLSAK